MLAPAFVGTLLGSLFVGAGLGWKLRRKNRVLGLLAAVAPLAVVLCVGEALAKLGIASTLPWNAARLVVTLAWVKGYRFYYGPSEGPVLNTIYGPLSFLPYLPVALFQRPLPALLAGGLITWTIYLFPMVALLTQDDKLRILHPLSRIFALLGFAIVLIRVFGIYSFSIRSDPPAIGFAAAAGFSLCRRGKARCRDRPWCSAICSLFSVWSKQTFVVVPLALTAYERVGGGNASGRRYLKALLIASAGVSGFCLAFFGPVGALFFNLFEIPARHPLRSHSVAFCLRSIWTWMPAYYPVLFVALALLVHALRSARRPERVHQALADNPWLVFLGISLCLLPTSCLAFLKAGGGPSNFCGPFYFLWLSVAYGLLCFQAGRGAEARACLTALPALISLALAFQACPEADAEWRWFSEYGRLLTEAGYRFSLDHPGEAYFPFNPLVTLMANGELYHFEYGIYDRDLAGFPLSSEEFRAHLPARMKYVAYSPEEIQTEGTGYLMRYLSEYSHRTSLPELPGWVVFRKE